jgi:hypothetical protein
MVNKAEVKAKQELAKTIKMMSSLYGKKAEEIKRLLKQ